MKLDLVGWLLINLKFPYVLSFKQFSVVLRLALFLIFFANYLNLLHDRYKLATVVLWHSTALWTKSTKDNTFSKEKAEGYLGTYLKQNGQVGPNNEAFLPETFAEWRNIYGLLIQEPVNQINVALLVKYKNSRCWTRYTLPPRSLKVVGIFNFRVLQKL